MQRLAHTSVPLYDTTFLENLGRAFYWQSLLYQEKFKALTKIAKAEEMDLARASRITQLAQLPPDIAQASVT